jgi:WXXGXW repeat (2 copies)
MHSRSRRLLSGIFYTVALTVALLLTSRASQAAVGIGISINIAPPELPVYEQPAVPGPGYIWTPGYWAWGEGDYYWVPGTWVEAPQPGYLWTPGYWGWNDGLYVWNGGYWGPHIGFYGGVNYGYGYIGHGYEGGYWDHGDFRYNRAYNNIHDDVHITNVYNKTVVIENPDSHVSFNGGHGGVQARPEANELAAEHEPHLTPVSAQVQHEQSARSNPALRASQNHGQPPIAATAHAGVFAGQGVMPARGAAALHTSTPGGGTPAHGPVTPAVTPHGAGPTAPLPAAVPPPHGGASGLAPAAHGASVPAGTPPHNGPPAATVQHAGTPGGTGHPGGGPPPPPRTPQHTPPEHAPPEHGAPEHERPEGH